MLPRVWKVPDLGDGDEQLAGRRRERARAAPEPPLAFDFVFHQSLHDEDRHGGSRAARPRRRDAAFSEKSRRYDLAVNDPNFEV